MTFPITRMRRLRRTETLRRMVRETRLSRDDLVLPLFVVEGAGVREPVAWAWAFGAAWAWRFWCSSSAKSREAFPARCC